MENPNFNQPDQNQGRARENESKLQNYAGPEGVTTKQLEVGLWYVEHKRQLKLALYGLLILIGTASWSYTIYGFVDYLIFGRRQDDVLAQQLVAATTVGHGYVREISAKDLAAGRAEAIKSGEGKYDLYAQLSNLNDKWWAEFDYYFTASGLKTKKTAGYILPSENKYLMALAQDFSAPPFEAALVVENLRWHRISQHIIPDWPAYSKSRLDIAVSDVKFTPAGYSPLSEKLNLNQLSFNLVNRTAYNYWEAGFAILLYGGGSLTNVNHYSLSDFLSGEKRSVELSWPGEIGRVDKVEIVPEINIMKDDIYIPHEGGTGQVK